ncbi:hypothetical protein [Geodermatophilus sp. SYSU D00700]
MAHATRFHGPTAPETELAKRDLRAAKLEAYVLRVLATAPRLTREQQDHIRSLMAPGTAGEQRRRDAARASGVDTGQDPEPAAEAAR